MEQYPLEELLAPPFSLFDDFFYEVVHVLADLFGLFSPGFHKDAVEGYEEESGPCLVPRLLPLPLSQHLKDGFGCLFGVSCAHHDE